MKKTVTQVIPGDKLDYFTEELGWKVVRQKPGGYVEIRKKLTKWQMFEMQVRQLFKEVGFEHAIDPEDFNFDKLGYQVDVAGGLAGHFVIMDCTVKNEPGFRSLRDKIEDMLFKKTDFERNVTRHFKGRYGSLHLVICAQDIDLDETEVRQAADRGIRLIPSEHLEQWFDLVDTVGPSLRYQVLERLTGEKIPIGSAGGPRAYEYPAVRIPLPGAEEKRHLYVFAIDPATLLSLAVVYRLTYGDPMGYQRELKQNKLKQINEYLSDLHNAFPNSIIVSFDEEGSRKLKWVSSGVGTSGRAELGILKIPKYYCIAEIIDGQHRLYGYLDFSEDKRFETALRDRRQSDRLIVVAYPDPKRTERPRLFLTINSTQTKIPTRQIWALMGETRPETRMGYISRLVREFNERGVLENKIEIPRITRGKRKINIANLGKGIEDRHLVDNSRRFAWNIYDGLRDGGKYPEEPSHEVVDNLNMFFKCVRDSHRNDWDSRDGFLATNNGVNVMLRVYAEILKHYYALDQGVTEKRIKDLLKGVVKSYIEEEGAEILRKRTSAEDSREKAATDIIERTNRRNRGFAVPYLQEKGRLRKRK